LFKLKRVFEIAQRLGIRATVIVGDDELKRGDYSIRIIAPLVQGGTRDFAVPASDVIQYGKLVKLRQNLERELSRIATGKSDLDRPRNLTELVTFLSSRQLLSSKIAGAVKDVVPTLNRAIHGQHLSEGSIEQALAYGNLLLNELESLSPVER
jgi:hypothetical protein